MWIVAGLGNPGGKYALHRHNVGFMALDAYALSIGEPRWREEKNALTLKFKLDAKEVLFVKPQTFMNKSGEPTRALMDFYKISPENLIVLHDELDIPFGALKFHKNRGPGGHNGLKSLNQMLGTQDYARIKMGVGRPPDPRMDIANYVLQNFSAEENEYLPEFLNVAGDSIDSIITDGLSKAASKFTRGAMIAPPVATSDKKES